MCEDNLATNKDPHGWGSIFVSLENITVTDIFADHFILFLHKHAWEKYWKTLFGSIFWGVQTVQKVPKHICIIHCWEYLCINSNVEIVLQFFKFYMYKLIGVKMMKDKNTCIYVYISVCLDRRMDGQMDGWMHAWKYMCITSVQQGAVDFSYCLL